MSQPARSSCIIRKNHGIAQGSRRGAGAEEDRIGEGDAEADDHAQDVDGQDEVSEETAGASTQNAGR